MEQRISVVTLGVADLDRSRRFYVEGLGWRPGFDQDGIVFFQAGRALLALFPRDALAADAQVPAAGFGGIMLAQCVSSRAAVDALQAEVKGAGAKILKPAHETTWGGYSGYFADPDGHPWEMVWNPAWTLLPDGGVRLGVSPPSPASTSPMEQRLSLVTVGIADLARARRFYVDRLGWRPGFENGDVIFFQLPGSVLALWSRESLAADAKISPSGFGGIALAQNVRRREDVDAVLATAARAGAKILKPAEDAPWGGYTSYFADPDGHPWEIAWNPGWTIEADGAVRLGGS
jgi:uncharacterized protein